MPFATSRVASDVSGVISNASFEAAGKEASPAIISNGYTEEEIDETEGMTDDETSRGSSDIRDYNSADGVDIINTIIRSDESETNNNTSKARSGKKRFDRRKWATQLERFNVAFREKRLVSKRKSASGSSSSSTATNNNTTTTTTTSLRREVELRKRLQEQLEILQGHYERLLQEKTAQQEEVLKAQAQLRGLQMAHEFLQADNRKMVQQQHSMNQLQVELNQLIAQQENTYQEHLSTSHRNLEQAQAALQHSQNQVRDLQKQAERLKAALQEEHEKFKKQVLLVESSETKNGSSSSVIQELNNKMKDLTSETNRLRAEHLATESARRRFENQLEMQSDTIAELEEELTISREELEDKEQAFQDQEEDRNRLNSQVESLMQEKDKFVAQLTRLDQAQQDREEAHGNGQSSSQNQDLRAQIQLLESQNENQRLVIQSLERQNKSLLALQKQTTLEGSRNNMATNTTPGDGLRPDFTGEESLQNVFQSWKTTADLTGPVSQKRHTVVTMNTSSLAELQRSFVEDAMKGKGSKSSDDSSVRESSDVSAATSSTAADVQRSLLQTAIVEKRRQSSAMARISTLFFGPEETHESSSSSSSCSPTNKYNEELHKSIQIAQKRNRRTRSSVV